MGFVLATERLRLRRVTTGDAGFLCELMNEPAYLKNIGDRGVRTERDAVAYIEDRFISAYLRYGYGLYTVERLAESGVIGICGFVRREVLDAPDLGFAFLERHRGQGYAIEAAAAVLDYGRTELRFRRILGVTAPGNLASIRLLEKLGLRLERRLRLDPAADEVLLLARDLGSGADSASG